MAMAIEKLQAPNDIKILTDVELAVLPAELRERVVQTVSENGGHLASNLGVVELTMALHLVFDLPKDKIVWDVGHQSYTHKLLTGRKEAFATLRKYQGLSGFPKREESPCDSFDTGHSSTSISAGLGLAWARDIAGEDYHVISVIGDGALTGGMAYEALNNAAKLKSNYIIVLNDNQMSISKNVGALSDHLTKIRTSAGYTGLKQGAHSTLDRMPRLGKGVATAVKRAKSGVKQFFLPDMLFENMGLMYLGPVDGHDLAALRHVLQKAAQVEGPVVVHVITNKGQGYEPAERLPGRFHGVAPFEVETGLPQGHSGPSYTDIFSTVMFKLGERRPKLCAITAAMMDGTGLKRFHNKFPKRFFDVGIAEEHAITFAAGLAAGGAKPVVALYSSFLQRGYDQIIHDICLQKLPVVLAVDRAGLVGSDGETHQGIFDISMLNAMPGMTLMAPKNKWELSDMLKFAVDFDGPIALRYPRGEAYTGFEQHRQPMEWGRCEELHAGQEVLLFALGSMVAVAEEARALLADQGIEATVVNARFAKPLDEAYLTQAASKYKLIATLEEGVAAGGMGESVAALLRKVGYEGKLEIFAIHDTFVKQGSVSQLLASLGLDAESIASTILDKVRE